MLFRGSYFDRILEFGMCVWVALRILGTYIYPRDRGIIVLVVTLCVCISVIARDFYRRRKIRSEWALRMMLIVLTSGLVVRVGVECLETSLGHMPKELSVRAREGGVPNDYFDLWEKAEVKRVRYELLNSMIVTVAVMLLFRAGNQGCESRRQS